MLNHLRSCHWRLILCWGKHQIRLRYRKGRRPYHRGNPCQPLRKLQVTACHLPGHTQDLGKPWGHQSPPRCLWLRWPCVSPFPMQSAARTTPKLLWKLGSSRPAGGYPKSPHHLCGQSALMTPSCWETLSSCTLGRGARLCQPVSVAPWDLVHIKLAAGGWSPGSWPRGSFAHPQTPRLSPHR